MKKAGIFILSLGICLSALEVVSGALLARLEAPVLSRAAVGEEAPDQQDHVLHPYVGFVKRYNPPAANRFGFFGDEPVFSKDEGLFVVGIFGGSLAGHFWSAENGKLSRCLETVPRLKDKKIRVVSVAMGGYKQPQQFMALAYLISLGARFDAVINLDGFNELALPFSENLRLGVSSFFPRNWPFYAAKSFDGPVLVQVGKIGFLEESARRMESPLNGVLSRSRFLALLRRIEANRLAARIAGENEKLKKLVMDCGGVRTNGPFKQPASEAAFFEECAGLWESCSLQMDRLCKANGIRYLHLLQPNQYVRGAKPLSREELATAYLGEQDPYRQAVEKGYGLLIEGGRRLKQAGVEFYDLTGIFAKETRTVYSDTCCHVNELGNGLLEEKICELLTLP